MTLAIVTDSTAGVQPLPPGSGSGRSVAVVPLHVLVGSASRRETIDIEPEEIARAQREGTAVSTSRPTPEEFARAYRALRDGGADAVLSIHLSARLSGTADAARLAAAQVGEDGLHVRVVNSGTTGAALAWAVELAATAPDEDPDAIADLVADRVGSSTRTLFYVDTLDYLRRGGRIGQASHWLGSALAIKPLLEMRDGQVAPLEKIRTRGKALSRLAELTRATADEYARRAEAAGRRARVGIHVQHHDAPAAGADLLTRLRGEIPAAVESDVRQVSAVLGVHVGPGLLAVTVIDLSS